MPSKEVILETSQLTSVSTEPGLLFLSEREKGSSCSFSPPSSSSGSDMSLKHNANRSSPDLSDVKSDMANGDSTPVSFYLDGGSKEDVYITKEQVELGELVSGLLQTNDLGAGGEPDIKTDSETIDSSSGKLTEVLPAGTEVEDPCVEWMKLDQSKFRHGPDQILPSDGFRTSNSMGAVKLRVQSSPPGNLAPMSIPSFFEYSVTRLPECVAMAIKRDGQWVKWTYQQYLKDVRIAAKAFIHLGLARFSSVCILGFNAPEWFISEIAAIYAGGFAAGIYTTNSPESCIHCAQNSKASIIVVEDEKQLIKFLPYKDQLPHLKAIVQYSGVPTHEGVLSWSQLMFLGTQQPDSILDERLKTIAINQCCTVIYTSGTTGLPKGVMLSHDNIFYTANSMVTIIEAKIGCEDIISFLPLSHVAAQVADIFFPIAANATVYFADKDALKGSLGLTLKEIRPTIFLGVPRVWEKIYEKMQEVGQKTKGVKKTIATWAKGKGWEYTLRKMNGNFTKPCCFQVANAIVFKKVKEALGLDRCTRALCGAAPLSMEVLKYFASLNIIVCEIYGMSETTAPHFLTVNSAFRLGSAGRTLGGCQTRLDNVDQEGNGEICMWGRNVFMGYLDMTDKTEEAMDTEGWLRSGDIGKMEDGFMYITGRIKELIITAGGENVAPVLIEDNIKAELPCISNVMLIGDRRKFLSCLLTFKTDVDLETGYPLDKLTPAVQQWCKNLGSPFTTVSDIIKQKDPKIYKAIQEGIDRANAHSTSNAQRVQKFLFLRQDFSIPGGELGPTMKLKRNVAELQFAEEIESIYAGP